MSAIKRIEKVLNEKESIAEVDKFEIFEYVASTLDYEEKHENNNLEKLAGLRMRMCDPSNRGERMICTKKDLEEEIAEIKDLINDELSDADNEESLKSHQDTDKETVAEDEVVEGEPIASDILHCEECGSTYNEEYEFCPKCGAKLVANPSENDSDDADTIKCEACGSVFSSEYEFCPECGAKVGGATRAKVSETAEPAYSAPMHTPADVNKRGASKKKLITIGAIAAAAIIAIIAFVAITSEKPLVLNGGNEIDIYVGEKEDITVVGEGLEEGDYQMTLWSTDNDKVLKVSNGEIEAFYDSDSFNAIEEDTGAEEPVDVCSCTTYVNAHIEKGIRKWGGSAKVNISIKPVELKDGKLIKKPHDSRDSSLTVKTRDDYDSYIYLKSKTKDSNDMSFTVKRGNETTVNVPRDEYELYWADGTTWYGSEFLFGPDTVYQKSQDDWDFKDYTWSFTMGVENGNVGSDSVGEDEFPEL